MLRPWKKTDDAPNANLVTFGYNIAGGFLIFCLGGYYLDQKRGNQYFWTLIGAGLGMLYMGYEVWKLTRSPKDGGK